MKIRRLGLALTVAIAVLVTAGVGSASAAFGISHFSNVFQDPAGKAVTQAGAHSDVVTEIRFNTTTETAGNTIMDGQVRHIEANLPAGFAGNPQAVRTCELEEIIAKDGFCDPAAQVGILKLSSVNFFEFPVYSMESPDEQTAVLAVVVFSIPAKIVVSARTDGDYGLTASLSEVNMGLGLEGSKLTLWGVPADPAHDFQRYGGGGVFDTGHPAGVPRAPFLSTPPRCGRMTTELKTSSWQDPDDWATATYQSPPLTGCDKLEFSPSLKARPTTNAADSPSGLDVDLEVPQNEDPDGLAVSHLRKAEVTLPEGLVINPSGATGLDACTPAQIGLKTLVGDANPHFDKNPARCPDAARIGSVEADIPALADPLKGSVYAAMPQQNPFGNLLTTYLVLEGKGLVIKVAGKVTPDPKTGRLTAIFDEAPQQPFEHFRLSFFGGALSVLRTPPTCGTYSTTSVMAPWSAPASGPPVTYRDSYAITQGANGQSCASSEAQLPNKPSFAAGSLSPIAGAYKPFVVNLKREDGTQQFSAVTLTPPPGLLAKLAGTPYCPDAALAAAAARTGSEEKASPSCPAASEVGNLYAAAGAGPAPYNAPGKVYLAGPYKGAPLSFAFVVPATAGPYDLGTVVTRGAAFVDPTSAEVTVKTDPLPQILQGIPLDVRSVSVRLDKPEFTKNPTSCDPFAITGSLLSTTGAGALLTNRFQVGECGRLAFEPKLSLKFKGKTKRTGNPAVTAVLKAPPGQANIAATTVILPKTQFIDNAHISNPCTRVQFDANACPPGSILGRARAFTPLLDSPLEGPVYFRSNGGARELPDMVVDLGGQIHVTLVGFIDSVRVKGTESSRVRTRFVSVPDAPVSKFVLNLKGGKKGLLENSVDLCRTGIGPATVQMEAHNADTAVFEQPIGTSCGKKKKNSKRSAK